MTGGSTAPSYRAPGFDGDDRFLLCHIRRYTGKAPRIAKAFEVQHNDAGAWIVGPIGQDIVAGDIRPVADRDERRQTHVETLHVVQHSEAERAALRQHANAACRWLHRGGKCRVEGNLRIGIKETHTVWPHQAHPRGAYQGPETLLCLSPCG